MFSNLKNHRLQAKRHADLLLHQAFVATGSDAQVFQRMVLHVQQHTKMLHILPAGGYCSWRPAAYLVDGLLALFAHRRSWRQDVESWLPTGGSACSQFCSL